MVAQAFRSACEAGLKPGEFWTLTPYETRICMEGEAERRKAEYRLALFEAWHSAAFQRAKRMPKLQNVMKQVSKGNKKRDLTPDQIWAGFRMHNAAMRGRDNRKKRD
jgi:hypothetical protein